MREQTWLRGAILVFWTLFWGLSVVDKIVPDVTHFWVGKDFFALFVKFFASLGLKDPMFATVALAGVSGLEAVNFTLYGTALAAMLKGDTGRAETWFYRGIVTSLGLFVLFSMADQVFGDRFQLLEHGLFWMVLLASWIAFKFFAVEEQHSGGLGSVRAVLLLGALLTLGATWSIQDFSSQTFNNVDKPVQGVEVVESMWKFDFPFLADKLVWEQTVNAFVEEHPELKVTYIYTGPSELNSKKKTHLLLYVFTERR